MDRVMNLTGRRLTSASTNSYTESMANDVHMPRPNRTIALMIGSTSKARVKWAESNLKSWCGVDNFHQAIEACPQSSSSQSAQHFDT